MRATPPAYMRQRVPMHDAQTGRTVHPRRNTYLGEDEDELFGVCKLDTPPVPSPSVAVDVDFSSVALYVPAIQLVFAVTTTCVVSLLSCLVFPQSAVSSVRNVALCSAAACLVLWRPVKLAAARGMDTVFNTIRPAAGVYILSLILEQLAQSCTASDVPLKSFRGWLFLACTIILLVAGFLRAYNPRSEGDYPFAAAALAVVLIALMPPSPQGIGGPLCTAASSTQALERVCRAVLFASVYCTLAFASAPISSLASDITINSCRAAAGSIWVLAASPYLLAAAPIQIGIALAMRLLARNSEVELEEVDQRLECVPSSDSSCCGDCEIAAAQPNDHELSFHRDEPKPLPFDTRIGRRFNIHVGPTLDATAELSDCACIDHPHSAHSVACTRAFATPTLLGASCAGLRCISGSSGDSRSSMMAGKASAEQLCAAARALESLESGDTN